MAIVQGIDKDGNLIQNDSYYNTTQTKANDALDKTAFLNLLVAEMKHQDPLNPASNTDYVAQLATFSQVEAMQNMQTTYQQQQGANLVGHPVIMKTESATGETGYICGRVEYMETVKGKVYLSVNGALYDIDDLDTVIEEDYYQNVVLKGEGSNDKTEGTTSDEKDESTEDDADDKKEDITDKV